MAEIAVEKKRAFPWWLWLLIAAAVAILLWALLGRGDTERGSAEGPITDLATLYAGNPDTLVGRKVRIENARVLDVTGDRDFWIGEGDNRQILVILNQVMTPQQPRIEGRYDVNAGQTLDILDGEVKAIPQWEDARSRWNLNQNLRTRFDNQRVYIEADKLDIKDWRESREPVQTQPK
jgi:hypothetical protein